MNTKFKPIYILPNLFTAGSIFIAVLSMLSALEGDFVKAAWFVFLSLLFDGLDGRVARMTKTTSRFGVEFDSLADIISFGMAPSLLLYLYAGHDYGRLGIVVAALFLIFGAIRLARFNVATSEEEPGVFIGLPIPTAAIFIATWILFLEQYSYFRTFEVGLLILSLFLSFLMVSNFRFPSFKKMDMPKSVAFKLLVVITVLLGLIYIFPVESFAVLVSAYICYGFCRGIYTIFLIKKEKF
ncbi:MAG: CDP-diacylglycerol--serine O-phosphatidyltransferase [Campylobacterota bacterium]